ncbi:MAG: carbohydrate ABC transporter permease [Eubacteriales bacterium]|nr:carbohydrate ABC transporter permease [Eubacteriales bacterium]
MKKNVQPVSLKREAKLLPGYLIMLLWLVFTVVLLGWIFAASLSTTREINMGKVLGFESGLHFENYAAAWSSYNVSVYFMNSFIYATCSLAFIILISAPASYVLSRFSFPGNKLIRSCFIIAMSIPLIMVILPVFGLTTQLRLNGSRVTLIILYTFLNIPFTTTFLMNFFSSLSRTYEEAAAIDGCTPTKTFWLVMLPLAQPGIVTVGIFLFLSVWNEYFMALIFATSDRLRSVGPGLYMMVDTMTRTGKLGGLFASVIIVFLPTFVIYLFLSEKIIAGVTGGGIKG